MTTEQEMRFGWWIADVNAEVQRILGCSVDDIPDCLYADWFDQGVSAKQAARWAVKQAIIV